ncbi:L-2-hydroxyglutarate oxidase [Thermomicrobium sp. 4228-Ro]|uniref:L-2-hydroxyglutarate oxidase n=1 Tax=Thermomicrobium sp. 4228-Ro TaxID=2993937 RepID=UPI002249448B|nr:L-2-hydroxyglutarate oxidase [Thermomicrobium sp. 4228-Ro]MCX2726037.1 L-2-hydroxyglutarate oxidase [Thermomicrobium sp. 4228-Ro]
MYDVIVIGAGIVGLATAREILQRRPRLRLAVLEKESRVAAHQSGHNSGVIHSGLYYRPGSLKARACVAGAAKLIRYCEERGIPYRLIGKLVVATTPDEVPRLLELYDRGQRNGVQGLQLLSAEEIREREPAVTGVRALWSPRTGIVDFARVAESFAEDVRLAGGEIHFCRTVLGFQRRNGRIRVETTGGDYEARFVVVCAGLYSDRLARSSGGRADPAIVPFRGDYYVLRPERQCLVKTNVYPVPDPRFPFLGVHFTPRMDGSVWLGPNAVLAFAREGYRKTDVNWRDLLETFRYPGFRRLARRYWRVGLQELWRDFSKRAFLRDLRRFVPELDEDDLVPGPAGVRAQALSLDGQLIDDFVLDRQPGIVHVRNAPSPAATSSLEIARLIVDDVEHELPS